jgi:hypothetical protein
LKYLILISIFISSVAFSGASKSKISILDYDQLMKLDVDTRAEYISRLQHLLTDIEAQQNRERMTYSTTGNNTAGLFIQLFATVMADWKGGEKCVFAGYVSETYKKELSDGTTKIVCGMPKIERNTCSVKGEIPCNVAVFGMSETHGQICIKPDKDATKNCMLKAGTTLDYSKFLLAAGKYDFNLKKEWAAMAAQIKSACTNNQEQSTICKIMVARLNEIERDLKIATARPATPPPPREDLFCSAHITGESDEKAKTAFPPMGSKVRVMVIRENPDNPDSKIIKIKVYSQQERGGWNLISESSHVTPNPNNSSYTYDLHQAGLNPDAKLTVSVRPSTYATGCSGNNPTQTPICNLAFWTPEYKKWYDKKGLDAFLPSCPLAVHGYPTSSQRLPASKSSTDVNQGWLEDQVN